MGVQNNRVFFITVIEYNRHFSVKNCHLEVYCIVDRLPSDDSILCNNSIQRVSIFKKPSILDAHIYCMPNLKGLKRHYQNGHKIPVGKLYIKVGIQNDPSTQRL